MLILTVFGDFSRDVGGRSTTCGATEDGSGSEGSAGVGDCCIPGAVVIELGRALSGLLGLTGLGVGIDGVAVEGRANVGTSDVAT